MFGVFQWNETSPNAAGTAFSSQAVQNGDSNSAAGILSGVLLDEYELMTVIGEFPGATGGTLDVYVQSFFAGHWYDFCHIKQLAAGAAMQRIQYVAGRATQTNGTVIGVDGTPALATDVIVGGVWGEKFRLAMVAGASTSAGAAVKVTITASIMRNAKR